MLPHCSLNLSVDGSRHQPAHEQTNTKRRAHAPPDAIMRAIEREDVKERTHTHTEAHAQAVKKADTEKQVPTHEESPVRVVNKVEDRRSFAVDSITASDRDKKQRESRGEHEGSSNLCEESQRLSVKHHSDVDAIQNNQSVENVGRENPVWRFTGFSASGTPDLKCRFNVPNAPQMVDEGIQLASVDPACALSGSKATGNKDNMLERTLNTAVDQAGRSKHVSNITEKRGCKANAVLRSRSAGSASSQSSAGSRTAPIAKPNVKSSSKTYAPAHQNCLRIGFPSVSNPFVTLPASLGSSAHIRPWTESLLCTVTPLDSENAGKRQEKNSVKMFEGNATCALPTREVHDINATERAVMVLKDAQRNEIQPLTEMRATSNKQSHLIISSSLAANDRLADEEGKQVDVETKIDKTSIEIPRSSKRKLSKDAKQKRNARNRRREKKRRLEARKESVFTEPNRAQAAQVTQDFGKHCSENTPQTKGLFFPVSADRIGESSVPFEKQRKGLEHEMPQCSTVQVPGDSIVASLTPLPAKSSNPDDTTKKPCNIEIAAPNAWNKSEKLTPSGKGDPHLLFSSNSLKEKAPKRLGPRQTNFKGKSKRCAVARGSVTAALTSAKSQGILCDDNNDSGKLQNVSGSGVKNLSTVHDHLASTKSQGKKSSSRRKMHSNKKHSYVQEEQYNESHFIGWEGATELPLSSGEVFDVFKSFPDSDPKQDKKSTLYAAKDSQKLISQDDKDEANPSSHLKKSISASQTGNDKESFHRNEKGIAHKRVNENIEQVSEFQMQEGQKASWAQPNTYTDKCSVFHDDKPINDQGKDTGKVKDPGNRTIRNESSLIGKSQVSKSASERKSEEQGCTSNNTDKSRRASPNYRQQDGHFHAESKGNGDLDEKSAEQSEVLDTAKTIVQDVSALHMSMLKSPTKRIAMPSSPKQTTAREVYHALASPGHDCGESDLSRLLQRESYNKEAIPTHLLSRSFHSPHRKGAELDTVEDTKGATIQTSSTEKTSTEREAINATSRNRREPFSKEVCERRGSFQQPLQTAKRTNEFGERTATTLKHLPTTSPITRNSKRVRNESSEHRDTHSRNVINSLFFVPHEPPRPVVPDPCDSGLITSVSSQQTNRPTFNPHSALEHKAEEDVPFDMFDQQLKVRCDLFGAYSEASSENISQYTTSPNMYNGSNQMRSRQKHDVTAQESSFQAAQMSIHQKTIDNESTPTPATCNRRGEQTSLPQRKGGHSSRPADFRNGMVQVLTEASTALEHFCARRQFEKVLVGSENPYS